MIDGAGPTPQSERAHAAGPILAYVLLVAFRRQPPVAPQVTRRNCMTQETWLPDNTGPKQ